MRMIDYANPAQAYGGDSLDNELGGQYTEEGYGSGRVKQGLLKNVLQDGYRLLQVKIHLIKRIVV